MQVCAQYLRLLSISICQYCKNIEVKSKELKINIVLKINKPVQSLETEKTKKFKANSLFD